MDADTLSLDQTKKEARAQPALDPHRHPNPRVRGGGRSLRGHHGQQPGPHHHGEGRKAPGLADDMAPVRRVRKPSTTHHRRSRTRTRPPDEQTGGISRTLGAGRHHAKRSIDREDSRPTGLTKSPSQDPAEVNEDTLPQVDNRWTTVPDTNRAGIRALKPHRISASKLMRRLETIIAAAPMTR